MRPTKEVEIWVDTFSKKVEVSAEAVHLGVRAQDEVVWRCQQGTAKICFPGSSPFRDRAQTYHCPQGGSVASGPVILKANKKARTFRYNILVEVVKPGKTKAGKLRTARFGKDPEVVVDPEPA